MVESIFPITKCFNQNRISGRPQSFRNPTEHHNTLPLCFDNCPPPRNRKKWRATFCVRMAQQLWKAKPICMIAWVIYFFLFSKTLCWWRVNISKLVAKDTVRFTQKAMIALTDIIFLPRRSPLTPIRSPRSRSPASSLDYPYCLCNALHGLLRMCFDWARWLDTHMFSQTVSNRVWAHSGIFSRGQAKTLMLRASMDLSAASKAFLY